MNKIEDKKIKWEKPLFEDMGNIKKASLGVPGTVCQSGSGNLITCQGGSSATSHCGSGGAATAGCDVGSARF